MKTIQLGYKALSILISSLVLIPSANAAHSSCQTYTMIASSGSPSRVVKVNCTVSSPKKVAHKRHYRPKTEVVNVYYVNASNCPCGAVYSGCQCYPDPWYEFERQNRSCNHVYMPGHWVGNRYEVYYVEPSTMNPPSTPYDPDVAYDPNDDTCINRF